MSKEYARSFYNSKAWKDSRQSYIETRYSLDGGLCERCKKKLGYIVHHKEHITPGNIDNVYITLSHCNLEYVCKQCHDDIHYEDIQGKVKEEVRYTFDEYGNIVPT